MEGEFPVEADPVEGELPVEGDPVEGGLSAAGGPAAGERPAEDRVPADPAELPLSRTPRAR